MVAVNDDEVATGAAAVSRRRPVLKALAGFCLLLAGVGALACGPLLIPRQTIVGGRIETTAGMMPPFQRRADLAGYVTWTSITAVGARGTFLYVFDAGRQQIFRYDLVRQTMTAFATYPGAKVTALAVAPDQSVYAADSGAQKVLHLSQDGRPLQTFSNPRELAQPVALALDQASGNLSVADGLYKHVVVFNNLGLLLDLVTPGEALGIVAMARGPAGLYLLDRIGRQVIVIGRDEQEQPGFGAESLKDPAAVAVDQFGRVFVADNFERAIKIFKEGQLIGSVGPDGPTPVIFSRIGGLWLEGNTLYAADSLMGRVQSFTVPPPD